MRNKMAEQNTVTIVYYCIGFFYLFFFQTLAAIAVLQLGHAGLINI